MEDEQKLEEQMITDINENCTDDVLADINENCTDDVLEEQTTVGDYDMETIVEEGVVENVSDENE